MNQTKSFRIVAEEIPFEHEHKSKIYNTFFAISNFYKNNPNPGACHLISSVFHVLLKEQGIENDLCIGEVTYKKGLFFDHSWIEIDEKVFDIAIQLTLQGEINPPVYAGYDLYTEKPVERVYGTTSPTGFDSDGKRVLKTSFVNYMNAYPNFKEGAWQIVKLIGKDLRLKFDLKEIPKRYANTQRKLISERK
ncbi:lasso peptide biosynthesis protein [Bacillus sp. AFS040349]|uniref:lasso peptide biosynthesis protein n=1 Tax=Bacillus sp. AFS040349 TaxID=2033502 RepID=UPI000BFB67D7|nr:lasso peptide biosynthesis protein [Bacillus sp. AFS040349]PGT83289.1 hypothetical protein COD11_13215 [Bacillus sp. AFS040349]